MLVAFNLFLVRYAAVAPIKVPTIVKGSGTAVTPGGVITGPVPTLIREESIPWVKSKKLSLRSTSLNPKTTLPLPREVNKLLNIRASFEVKNPVSRVSSRNPPPLNPRPVATPAAVVFCALTEEKLPKLILLSNRVLSLKSKSPVAVSPSIERNSD